MWMALSLSGSSPSHTALSHNFPRRRTAEATSSDLDGLSDQLQSVSLAISAALDRENADGGHTSMEELRQWYQTEVFAATDAQQQRWEERRWAFLGQLQHASAHFNIPQWHFILFSRHVLRKPLTHTVSIAKHLPLLLVRIFFRPLLIMLMHYLITRAA